jgi:predicted nucleotidyltransferase
MRGDEFDELEFFRAIHDSGARALLIGRRALVILGLPVLTADYDFWLAIDDIDRFNGVLTQFDLQPTKSVDAARQTGRYVLENNEHIDVLVARSVSTRTGEVVAFDDVWPRRQRVELADGVHVQLPSIDDLISTKRFSLRPRDVEDIRLLEAIKLQKESRG